uniref:Uncharacterized protein n=1 Tax=Brassica oleracea TaxID=3712 RepID=A0A3P6ETA6_BRAOL|nr:unnamed protein product [Brassica oleracea]
MADFLHKAIRAMSIEEDEEPLTLPDEPRFHGPPGFPPLFPELSKQDQQMALLYISHADETERRARIERVKQGIAESAAETSVRLTKITNELDKETCSARKKKPLMLTARSEGHNSFPDNDEADSSATNTSCASTPALVPTGFQLGPSSEGRVTRNLSGSKTQRRRPPSWKRKSNVSQQKRSYVHASPSLNSSKRKSSPPPSFSDNKTIRED